MTWKELGLKAELISALEAQNIQTPTEIQAKSLPILLNKKTDFIGQAQTGTGKTIAFALPILSKVDASNNSVQALILAPTRELCVQIHKQIFKLTKHTKGIFSVAVYGGENMDRQISLLSKPTQIVVATPGRLLDLLDKKALTLDELETLVVDEADEMITMGFKNELDEILKFTNEKAFTWLFSATMGDEVNRLINTYLSKELIKVEIEAKQRINKNIEHQYYVCPDEDKPYFLSLFLKTQPKQIGIIFCKTKAGVDKLTKMLKEENYAAEALHGDLNQTERDKVMRAFRKRNLRLLVATDISARGIDVEDIAFVVHYELPERLDNYTHRSGRTARAGKRGISLSFVKSRERKYIRMIEDMLQIRFIKL
jgi:ATP-dependent RNA helicase DeaD